MKKSYFLIFLMTFFLFGCTSQVFTFSYATFFSSLLILGSLISACSGSSKKSETLVNNDQSGDQSNDNCDTPVVPVLDLTQLPDSVCSREGAILISAEDQTICSPYSSCGYVGVLSDNNESRVVPYSPANNVAIICGTNGNDRITLETYYVDHQVLGGAGDDEISAGPSLSHLQLKGGAGSDTYRFSSSGVTNSPTGFDELVTKAAIIYDFNSSEDSIVLDSCSADDNWGNKGDFSATRLEGSNDVLISQEYTIGLKANDTYTRDIVIIKDFEASSTKIEITCGWQVKIDLDIE